MTGLASGGGNTLLAHYPSMPVMTFSLLTSEATGSSRPDSWKRGIFWGEFDTSVLAETTNRSRSWEFLTGRSPA